MERKELRIKTIDKISETFTWLDFIGWSNKESEYDLVKFQSKIDSEFILWAYVYDSKVDREFRESTKIDKEYRDIKSENIISLIEDIKYIY